MKMLNMRWMLVLLLGCSILAVSCKPKNPAEPEQDTTPIEEQDPQPEPQPEPEPELLTPVNKTLLNLDVPVTENWIFRGKPALTIHVENTGSEAGSVEAKVKISTDKGEEVVTVSKSMNIAGGEQKDMVITTEEDLPAGFYKAACTVNGKSARKSFVFGVDPEDIVSAPDKQDDFDAFWANAKAQLEGIEMNAQLTEITNKSTTQRKVYLVELQSVPDGLEGEPVTVRGYYCEPQDGQKHAVVIHYFGYDDQNPSGKLHCPGGSDSKHAEFFFGTRGQNVNNRTAEQREPDGKGDFVNIYGDWFGFQFGQRDGWYYRGAFMDCVQAVRFMATRETSDMERLFAEGTSQGGAFSYAAAALSDYPFAAIAPGVAFLGDFPDYFDIVSWPANTARSKKGSMSNDEMFAFLSYFDTKNLATRIGCPVVAYICLQDGTCPPHTNIAPYNNLSNPDKELYFYPTQGHEVPSTWATKYKTFFRNHGLK